MPDLSEPGYWNSIYLTEQPGWDKGKVSPPIARLIAEGVVPRGVRVAVLGAGRGHDAVHLAREGFTVTAVDFAEEAARGARENAAKSGVTMTSLPRSMPAVFDAVLEHTCFCAIDPARRREYAEVVRTILAPGGVFFGVLYNHGREGGPPFDTTEREIREIFSPAFSIERLRVAPEGFPERVGKELEFVFRALPSRP